MLCAFVDFFLSERILMHYIFANAAIGQAISAARNYIKNNGAFVILNGANHHSRRPVKTVPASVITANQSGRIDRRGDAFPTTLHAELIVRQKISLRGIADL